MNCIVIATNMGLSPLLPLSDTLVVESALTFCVKNTQVRESGYFEGITLVTSSGSPIPDVLKCRGWKDVTYVTQFGNYGLVDAITRGALVRLDMDQPLLITFADVVYYSEEMVTSLCHYVGSSTGERDCELIVMHSRQATAGLIDTELHTFLEHCNVKRTRNSKIITTNIGSTPEYLIYIRKLKDTFVA